ncbi:EscU/YscU/HrcU family type III secretion system export apparatus switch protein [Limimaricola sp. AA108-03]|uniref:EscU/YscU/HrcU family type III secretion system export apparatus switch protein n=1 Tax=Limimaricola sp. AA108-03 TaxID=3425945 RepID=UPI003D77A131
MSGNEDAAEKSHEPSQKKLDEARKRGEVPRSTDLITAAGYGGLVLAGLAAGPMIAQALGTALMAPLDRAGTLARDAFAGGGRAVAGGLIWAVAGAIWPLFVAPAALALLAVLAQRGLVFAPGKIRPKPDRISPIKGLGNKFGRAGLFEFAKSFAKLVLYCVVLAIYLRRQMPRLLGQMQLSPGQIAAEMGRLCLGLMSLVLLVALALGALDLLFQRAEHLRHNRMSRKELTDETRESEGDPHLKGQRRQKGVEIAMSQMIAEVPKAEVVMVNPTHYAVALAWDRAAGGAPRCVAKGVDAMAARIREVAAEAGVPLRSDPPSARALYATVEIGQEIAPEQYRAVAAAIRFAEAMRRKRRGR